MLNFAYDMLPSRVVFGVGCLDKLPEEIERLGAHRALVLSTPEQRKEGRQIVDRLGARAVGLFDKAVMHVPIEIAEQAREQAKALGADCCVAIGGGSTTGLAKAIALVSTLPILAIPTTYAGSEMTPIWGITESGLKKTGRDPRVLPKTVLYEPTLTVTHAADAVGHQRHELHRALCGSAVFERRESDRLDDRRRRDSRAGRGTSHRREGAGESGGSLQRAVWRVAGRNLPRRSGDGAASQAVPHSGRQFQSAARGDSHRGVAACDSLYRAPPHPTRCRALHERWAHLQRRRACTI